MQGRISSCIQGQIASFIALTVAISVVAMALLYIARTEEALGAAQAPAAPEKFKVNPKGWTKHDGFSVSWKNPESESPIVGAYYKIDSPPKGDDDGQYVQQKNGGKTGMITELEVGTEGSHSIYVWLKDEAGNVSATNREEGQLKFDKTPPEAPQKLAVNPYGWTAKNSFTVYWTNPDTSGVAPITGAYYKLDTVPAKSNDGTYLKLSSQDPSVAVYGLQVPTAGKHGIYVWLKDAAGNVSHKYLAFGYLLYAPKSSSSPAKPGPQEGGVDSGLPSPGEDEGVPQSDLPQITGLGMTRKYFRVKNNGRSGRAGRWKMGTKIAFTLTRSSKTTFTVVRNITGRKRGRSCKKVRKARRKLRKKGTRCSLFKTVGSFAYSGQEGSNAVKFSGRLNGKRLKPGLYHVYVRVSGATTSAPPFLSFRVVHSR